MANEQRETHKTQPSTIIIHAIRQTEEKKSLFVFKRNHEMRIVRAPHSCVCVCTCTEEWRVICMCARARHAHAHISQHTNTPRATTHFWMGALNFMIIAFLVEIRWFATLAWIVLTMRNGLVCIRTVSVNGISGFSAIGTPLRVNVVNIDQWFRLW